MPPELMRLIVAASQQAVQNRTRMVTSETGPYSTVDLDSLLRQPVFQDTLAPIFGATPEIRGIRDISGLFGKVGRTEDGRGEPVIEINRIAGHRAPSVEQVAVHEFTHIRDILKDPAIEEIRPQLLRKWEEHVRTMDLPLLESYGTPGTREFRSNYATIDPAEHIASAVENALELMRMKAPLQAVDAADQQLPGTRLVYDQMQKRLKAYERRFGKPLPTPETRDSVRMRIRP